MFTNNTFDTKSRQIVFQNFEEKYSGVLVPLIQQLIKDMSIRVLPIPQENLLGFMERIYAAGDWILWLDADEELDKDEKTNLSEILANTKANILSLPVLNYHGESEPVDINNVFLYYQPRLFRNHLTIKFTNRIHETIQQPENLELIIENIPVSIHH